MNNYITTEFLTIDNSPCFVQKIITSNSLGLYDAKYYINDKFDDENIEIFFGKNNHLLDKHNNLINSKGEFVDFNKNPIKNKYITQNIDKLLSKNIVTYEYNYKKFGVSQTNQLLNDENQIVDHNGNFIDLNNKQIKTPIVEHITTSWIHSPVVSYERDSKIFTLSKTNQLLNDNKQIVDSEGNFIDFNNQPTNVPIVENIATTYLNLLKENITYTIGDKSFHLSKTNQLLNDHNQIVNNKGEWVDFDNQPIYEDPIVEVVEKSYIPFHNENVTYKFVDNIFHFNCFKHLLNSRNILVNLKGEYVNLDSSVIDNAHIDYYDNKYRLINHKTKMVSQINPSHISQIQFLYDINTGAIKKSAINHIYHKTEEEKDIIGEESTTDSSSFELD